MTSSLGYLIHATDAPSIPLDECVELRRLPLEERLPALPRGTVRQYGPHLYVKKKGTAGGGAANWRYSATVGTSAAAALLAKADEKGLAKAPEAAEGSTALGRSVDRSFPRITEGPHRKAIERVIALMASLHGTDGQKLASLPVVSLNDDKARKTKSGSYQYDEDSAPASLVVRPWADHPMLTFAHEAGHYFDHQGLGAVEGAFGSEGTETPEWTALRSALEKSRAVQSLRALQDHHVATKQEPSKYIDYLLRRRELFARAYAQWVAVRSGDAAARAELDSIRPKSVGEDGTKKFLYGQWSDEDFEPIAAAMDSLFVARGWMKNP